jgi:hypothetical protein
MPHKRLFRFIVIPNITTVPDSIKKRDDFPPLDVTGYFVRFFLDSAADGPLHNEADGSERVPDPFGVVDFLISTVEGSKFWLNAWVLPNSKVDPDAHTSDPLWHKQEFADQQFLGQEMSTDDFAPVKASEYPELVKEFPHGFFIIKMDLVAVYQPLLLPGLPTPADFARLGLRQEDFIFHIVHPTYDSAGKLVSTNHEIVFWNDRFRLSDLKYIP